MTESSVPAPSTGIALDSPAVRERLVEVLNLDPIGPDANHELAAERLPGWIRPSNWYLTGFLIPSGTRAEDSADLDEGDDIDEVRDSGGLAEESTEERKAAKKSFFPSSMGLASALMTGLLPPSSSVAAVRSTLGLHTGGEEVLGALNKLEQLGISGKAAAAWLQTLEKAQARTVTPDLVWSGPEVPGIHARDTRRVYEELIGGDDQASPPCGFLN